MVVLIIFLWKSKGLSDEIIKTSAASDNSFALPLDNIGTKKRVKFNRSYLQRNKITFTQEKIVNIYIVYKIGFSTRGYNDYTVLKNSSFRAVKIVKTADINKYKYSEYGISIDRSWTFLFSTSEFGCNVIIFNVDMSSLVHADNKKKIF